MKIVYAIPNCNTVKKALDWLKANKIAYEFHDYKKKGITDTWPYEFDYDAEWWENKYNELLNY